MWVLFHTDVTYRGSWEPSRFGDASDDKTSGRSSHATPTCILAAPSSERRYRRKRNAEPLNGAGVFGSVEPHAGNADAQMITPRNKSREEIENGHPGHERQPDSESRRRSSAIQALRSR